MPRAAGLAIVVSILLLSAIAPPAALAAPSPGDTLSFEVPGTDLPFAGWSGGPRSRVAADSAVVHGGRRSARIMGDSTRGYAWIERSVPVWFAGDTLTLRVWLRLRGVTGSAQLLIYQNGSFGEGVPTYTPEPGLAGSLEWAEYTQSTVLRRGTTSVAYGVGLNGAGTLNVDDVRLEVNGRPLELAGKRPPSTTGPRHEITDSSLALVRCDRPSPVQVANLVLLARVWGFAKYHHPGVTAGKIPWDAELIRVLPGVLAAHSHANALAVLSSWLERFPLSDSCRRCAVLPADAAVLPPIAWIHDRGLLGEKLCRQLERIYARREVMSEQFYVGQGSNGTPDFIGEEPYREHVEPSVGLRLLALFRLWNAVEYWSPHRGLIADEWDAVLPEFVPRFVAADSRQAYGLAVLEVATHLHDSHADAISESDVRPPVGPAVLPVRLQHVEGKFVVIRFRGGPLGKATGLEVGDVLTALDGVPVDSIVARYAKYYGGSNDAWVAERIGQRLTRGPAGPCRVSGLRDGRAFERVCTRDSALGQAEPAPPHHDLPMPAFRFLDPEVAYVAPLTATMGDSSTAWVNRAAGTRCLIVDLRSYPRARPLAYHMVSRITPVASATQGDLGNPGAFEWRAATQNISAIAPRYDGKVVVIVDECTISQAEYMAMMLRAGPNAMVVGSTTAGADGNSTRIPLPGGEHVNMTGGGIFWPDRRPTQRVGVVPDVKVRPTIAGIRSGHDEVLEAAILAAIGRKVEVVRD